MIATGVLLRLCFLGTDSFWLDEAFSVSRVLNHSARELWAASPDQNHPSLYFVILLKALEAGGTSEAVARLPSALASICNFALLFVLAMRLGMTKTTAVGAVLLLALAPVDMWYAQETRMYAMVTTTGLLLAVVLTMDSWLGTVLTCAALTLGLYLDFTMIPLSAGVSLICAVVTVATPRADWRGVVAHLNASIPGPTTVVIDPIWNSIPYDYYRPKIAPAAGPPAAGGGEMCLIAERFGRKPPTSASEAWLDAHARLTKVVPFARLELRCYQSGARAQ